MLLNSAYRLLYYNNQKTKMTHNLETTLKTLDLFGKLKPEKRVEIIKPKVKRNETLDRVVRGYEKGLENYGLYQEGKLKIKIPEYEDDWYYIAKSSAPSEISSNNITEFSLLLGEHENKKYFRDVTGLYLSALINSSKDKDFKIITNYLSKAIHYVGYKNRKNIDVNGNAGDWVGGGMENGKITINGNAGWGVGDEMKDGKITVNGNAEGGVGYEMKDGKITVNGNAGLGVGYGMEDGEITVNGNTRDGVGWDMKDGEITVNGNAGERVGWYMEGGKIHLNGDYEGLARYISGGNIYHKDKLIVKGGKKIRRKLI